MTSRNQGLSSNDQGRQRRETLGTRLDLDDFLNSLNSCKYSLCAFVTCPKQGIEMEAVVLHRVGFLAYFCPKQGQDFKPSAAPLYPNMGQVTPPPPGFSPPPTFNVDDQVIFSLFVGKNAIFSNID